jgi:hypothetical protein
LQLSQKIPIEIQHLVAKAFSVLLFIFFFFISSSPSSTSSFCLNLPVLPHPRKLFLPIMVLIRQYKFLGQLQIRVIKTAVFLKLIEEKY